MAKLNDYFFDTIKNRYEEVQGRETRSEYWYFVLFSIIFSILFTLIDMFILNPAMGIPPESANQAGILSFIFILAMLLPRITLGVRRLHDIGKSGWWYLLVLIPIIGALILLFFFVQDSQLGTNIYGSNPKGT